MPIRSNKVEVKISLSEIFSLVGLEVSFFRCCCFVLFYCTWFAFVLFISLKLYHLNSIWTLYVFTLNWLKNFNFAIFSLFLRWMNGWAVCLRYLFAAPGQSWGCFFYRTLSKLTPFSPQDRQTHKVTLGCIAVTGKVVENVIVDFLERNNLFTAEIRSFFLDNHVPETPAYRI